MVSSKGMAGVPRGSLVVVAAIPPMFHLPEAGILLIIGTISSRHGPHRY